MPLKPSQGNLSRPYLGGLGATGTIKKRGRKTMYNKSFGPYVGKGGDYALCCRQSIFELIPTDVYVAEKEISIRVEDKRGKKNSWGQGLIRVGQSSL